MDIVKCVEILRSRHEQHATAGGPSATGCDCASRGSLLLEASPPPPPGIVADLLSYNSGSSSSSSASSSGDSQSTAANGEASSSVAIAPGGGGDTSSVLPPLSSPASSVLERIRTLPLHELIGVVQSLQSERVQTYKIFDEILNILIEEERIGEYKMLCGEVTSRFATISKAIRDIISELKLRGQSGIAVIVEKVQLLEKEKLTLYASKHIDQIQARSADLREHFPTSPQTAYISSSLARIESEVADLVEALQAEKSELLLDENT